MAKELVDKITILEFKQELKGHLNNVMEVLNEAKEEIIRLVKENKELKAQIEKMKCCENCQTVCDANGNCYQYKDGKCNPKDKTKWEMKK